MPTIPRALRGYGRDAAGAFRLAPLEVLLGVVVAATFSATLRSEEFEGFTRLVVSAALALPLLFGLSVLRARGVIGGAARWGGAAAVLLAAAVYGGWIFDPDRQAEGWRFVALLGAAWLSLFLVPAAGVERGPRRRVALWHFDFLLLARIIAVVGYGVALYAALAGAVAAVSSLFELDTPEELYGDLFGAVFFALVPWVVVGGIPELTRQAEEVDVRRGVRLLGRYLYTPVLVVYLAILLAYALKVLATGEIPKNLLSPIVLLAGLFGFLGSVLLEPLERHPEHTGVARFIRLFPVLLLPLLPLAGWALWVRLDQYGWTEFRYLRFVVLLALGALAVLGTVRLVRRREPVLVSVPAVLGAALLLAAVGPWSATAVSRRSQQERLRDGLREAGLLRDGRVHGLAPREVAVDTVGAPGPAGSGSPAAVPAAAPAAVPAAREVPKELYDRITGSLAYLYDAHGPEAVRPFFAGGVEEYGGGWSLAQALPIRAACDPENVRWGRAWLPDSVPVPVPAGTLYRVERAGREEPGESERGRPVQLRVVDSGVLVRSADGWTARVELAPLVSELAARGVSQCGPRRGPAEVVLTPERARFPLVDGEGRARGEMILTNLVLDGGEDGRAALQHVSAMVVLTR